MADFNNVQIQQFITNWFNSDLDIQSKTAENCWNALKHESNKAARELAQTPLLLTFLCLVYNRKQSFPATRSRLYNKALDILLEEWAAEKRIKQEVIHEGLHIDLEKEMLAEIAYHNFVDDKLFFEEQRLVFSIRDFLAQTDNLENPKKLDGKKILNAIAAQQGILVERAEDIYSFSHLTLQEYLTAQYISEDYEKIEQLVTEHLVDRRWREVFILVAGLKGNADKLLKLMETATQQLMNTDRLKKLLIWVKAITDPNSGDFQPLGKRALAIANAQANTQAKAYAYAYAIDIIIDDLVEYTRTSDKFQIYQNINYSQLLTNLEEFKQQQADEYTELNDLKILAKQVLQTVQIAFSFDSDMINLSTIEIQSLENYLYASYLMIDCKKSAVRVSKDTWQGIESRMLLPTNNQY